MRIKVILNADPGDFIDINYQYSLAAWIYRVMDKSNSGSAEFWHNSGLSFSETDNRRYKFFTFSNLYIPKFRLEGRRMYILSDYISFIFSTYIDEIGCDFIGGLSENPGFYVGKYLKVKEIQVLREDDIKSGVILKAKSPIYVQSDSLHLNPIEHKDIYSAAIHKNLSSKYNVFYKSDRHDFIQTSVTIVSGIRQKLITIKEGKDSETKIKGFFFTFKEMITTERGSAPEEFTDLKVEFKYDLEAFFNYFDWINASKFAAYTGINESKMRQYKTGVAFAGEKTTNKILKAIKKLGAELSAASL
jgi:CRISPR-associated endoribonuclease Cas6